MTRSPRHSGRLLTAAAVLLAVSMLTMPACTQTGSRVDADLPIYPAQLSQTVVLDIQVVRDDTKITFTNTTARSIGKSRMWINGWFSHDIKGLGVGETMTLELYDFRDTYGTQFRGGGFFASDRPERVVLAQIEPLDVESGELLGLVVVGRSDE